MPFQQQASPIVDEQVQQLLRKQSLPEYGGPEFQSACASYLGTTEAFDPIQLIRLAKAAPQAVEKDAIVYNKLPAHLPHQVEVVLGQEDLFPYRVTYLKYDSVDGKYVLKPAVTTEFYEVTFRETLDQEQFIYKQPANLGVVDRTDAFISALGINPKAGVATRPATQQAR